MQLDLPSDHAGTFQKVPLCAALRHLDVFCPIVIWVHATILVLVTIVPPLTAILPPIVAPILLLSRWCR
jgi:hypothetical protein